MERRAKKGKKEKPKEMNLFFSVLLVDFSLLEDKSRPKFQQNDRRLLWILQVETTDSGEKEREIIWKKVWNETAKRFWNLPFVNGPHRSELARPENIQEALSKARAADRTSSKPCPRGLAHQRKEGSKRVRERAETQKERQEAAGHVGRPRRPRRAPGFRRR